MDEVEVECKSGIYPNLDDIVVEDGPTLLLPCIMCNKTFIPEVLQRHSKVCEKANKKRKTFDSFKQRVQGTDLAEFLPYTTLQKRASISEKPTSPQKTSSRWKENHEAFVSAIRAARGEEQDAQGGSGDSRSLLRPPDQCPYCERHFGKKAFDRHQEWCREQHSRQPPVIASSQAKERLEARIKYRAPPLKSKRSITREKYSPLVQRKVRQASPSSHSTFSGHSTAGSATSSAGSSRHTAQSQQEQSNRLTKSGNTLSGKPQPKESQSGLGFNRGMAGRTSLRASQRGTAQRSSSPTKRTPGINTSKVTASPSQRPSKADSPPRIFDKEDMTIISSGLKKSLNKRQSTKQMDGKEIDRQDSKAEKKSSHMANTQAMHNEVNAKESKENVNNRKSSKNEHMWRQGCQAKHTPSYSLPSNPHSPTVPLSVGSKANRKKLPSKAKSVEVNSYVTEMIITRIGPHNSQSNGPMYQESISNTCHESFVMRDMDSSHWNLSGTHVNAGISCPVPDMEGSASSLILSSCSETPVSSSRSADSNRTYVTQTSSLCFKAENSEDVAYDPHISRSDTNLKSYIKDSETALECFKPESENDILSGKETKGVASLELLHGFSDVSDRERSIPRKRVKVCQNDFRSANTGASYPPSGFSHFDPSVIPVPVLQTSLSHSLEVDCTGKCTPPPYPCYIKESEKNVPCSPDDIIEVNPTIKYQLPCNEIDAQSHHTSWVEIAKNTTVISPLISFNTQPNSKQPSLCKAPDLRNYDVYQNNNERSVPPQLGHETVMHQVKNTKCYVISRKKRPPEINRVYLPTLPKPQCSNHRDPHWTCQSNPSLMSIPKNFAHPDIRSRNPSSIRLQPLPTSLNLSGSQHQEAYDPYASAERQMMELLRSDSACNIKKQKSPSPAPSISPMPSPTLSPKPSSLETSPTSAFTRYAKELEFPVQIGNEQGSVGKRKFSGNCDKEKDASIQASLSNSSVNHVHSAPQTEVPAKNKTAEPALPPPAQPQPPPRSNRRLASLPYSRNMENLVVCGIGTSQLQQQSDDSLDAVLKEFNNAAGSDLDNRPKTYDLDSHSQKESWEKGGWLVVGEQSSQRDVELPTIIDSGDGGKIEILNLENRGEKMERRETRESREIREITEQEPTISNIDNLLEEVVRMQRSVSMLSEIDPVTSKVTSQSSARSRRNRAGKMLIEDFLFPAELLVERENNNFRSTVDSSDRSNSVFGSTKSRKSSSKGRRLIEDMLFPAGTDFNANSDHNEDADVVVSANALAVTYTSPHSFNSKLDSLICPTSPVALTSQAPNTADGDDGLPRPKPMSLSAHSTARNGCKETNERERGPHSHSGPNQGRQSTSSRLSADSAYSSLNRRSPVAQVRRQGSAGAPDIPRHGAESPQSMLSQSLTQSLVLSSSGSESSLPPLSVSQQLKRGGARVKNECDTPSSDIISATTPLLPKLSKFCHHCGTKFLISVAKFCHECGAARLEIC